MDEIKRLIFLPTELDRPNMRLTCSYVERPLFVCVQSLKHDSRVFIRSEARFNGDYFFLALFGVWGCKTINIKINNAVKLYNMDEDKETEV